MNNDDPVGFDDREEHFVEWEHDQNSGPLILESVNDPWAQTEQDVSSTAVQATNSYVPDASVSSFTFVQNSEENGVDPPPTLTHPLPYNLTSATLQDQLETTLDLLEPREPYDNQSAGPSDVLDPLHIDSTRTVWNKLTTVNTKRIKFEGSNVKAEMISILRAWHTRTKNQPSWTRPVSIQIKKNRESIGPAIFGWGRTDVPAWVDTPRTPRSSRFSPVFQETPVERHKAAVEDDSFDFGNFESAHPSAIMAVFDGPLTDSPVFPAMASQDEGDSTLPSKVADQNNMHGLGILDFDELPLPNDVPKATKMKPPPVMSDVTIIATVVEPSIGNDKGTTTTNPENTSHVSDPWDLSVFESQLTINQPVPAQAAEQAEVVANTAPINSSKGVSGSKKTAKEMADEATVERIVSLLPDLDYLLS